MPRLAPRPEVLRALFARSGNRCSFPGCPTPLINEKHQFIAQVCHIEAAEDGGERFNRSQTDEQRRSYENLILLCYPHHVETDDVGLYSAERLREIKHEHEQVFGQKLFQIDESLLHKIASEMANYWAYVAQLHRDHHVASDLAIEIDATANYIQLADQASDLLSDLHRIQAYLIESDQLRQAAPESERPVSGPNDFGILYIGLTNTITKLAVITTQMEIKYLEEFLKLNPADHAARTRLEARKAEFSESATSAGYVD